MGFRQGFSTLGFCGSVLLFLCQAPHSLAGDAQGNPPLTIEQGNTFFDGNLHFFSGSRELPEDPEFPEFEDEISLDGETLRFLLAAYGDLNLGIDEMLERIQLVNLKRQGDFLAVSLIFDDSFTAKIEEKGDLKSFGLYGIRVPKESKILVRIEDGYLDITQMSVPKSKNYWKVLAKLPFLPDRILLKRVHADLVNGEIEFFGSAIGSLVQFMAKGKLVSKSFQFGGLAFGKTLKNSILHLFNWNKEKR